MSWSRRQLQLAVTVQAMGFWPSWLDSKAALTFITWFRLARARFFWSTAFFRKETLQGQSVGVEIAGGMVAGMPGQQRERGRGQRQRLLQEGHCATAADELSSPWHEPSTLSHPRNSPAPSPGQPGSTLPAEPLCPRVPIS